MPEYSPADLRQLDVLGNLICVTDERTIKPQARPQDLLSEGAGHDATSALRDKIRALEAVKPIVVGWRFNGGWSAKPTGAGRDAWTALDTARNDRRARRFQLRDVYLRWVVDLYNVRGTADSLKMEIPMGFAQAPKFGPLREAST